MIIASAAGELPLARVTWSGLGDRDRPANRITLPRLLPVCRCPPLLGQAVARCGACSGDGAAQSSRMMLCCAMLPTTRTRGAPYARRAGLAYSGLTAKQRPSATDAASESSTRLSALASVSGTLRRLQPAGSSASPQSRKRGTVHLGPPPPQRSARCSVLLRERPAERAVFARG